MDRLSKARTVQEQDEAWDALRPLGPAVVPYVAGAYPGTVSPTSYWYTMATLRYWAILGRGRWGGRLRMAARPRLPSGYDPRRVLLGDLDGNGLADLVYVGADRVTVWINRIPCPRACATAPCAVPGRTS